MGTTAQKLQAIIDSKEAIKIAIEDKGVTVGDAKLSEYAGLIDSIETESSFSSKVLRYMPLTFETIDSGTFTFTNSISYSLDSGNTWTELSASTATPTIAAGKIIMFKGSITPTQAAGAGTFSATGKFNAYGNPLSLINSTNFASVDNISSYTRPFFRLFYNNKKLVSAKNLSLPYTTLAVGSFTETFYGCTSLIDTPALPATTVPNQCYWAMFKNCTSLVTISEISATSLGTLSCTSMFYGCTSLSKIQKDLYITTLASESCTYMFYNCSSLVHAPSLPATTPTYHCYYHLFDGCSSLMSIKCLLTTIKEYVAEGCIENWVNGVNTTGGVLTKSSSVSYPTGASGKPSGWTTVSV